MQYEEIIEIIQSKRRFGKAYGRDVTAEMMERLEHPETGMKIIHIAGTNGKGSTAAFVSSILHAAGFVVGRFTSPHLIRFTERIVVDGEEIGKDDVIRLGERVLELPMRQETTMFDLCLGMAVLYFKEMNCDFVVLETGLGGAKDSTAGLSVVPEVCAFTNIGYDHTAILGNTIEEIAAEKAGILKKGTHAVLGIMDEKAADVIKKQAEILDVPITNVDNLLTKISTYEIPLNGVFQRANATLAVGVVETLFNNHCGYLGDNFLSKKEEIIRQGLAETKWPGRMEVLSEKPYVLVDGAHNPQGVEALFNSLKNMFPDEKFVFLVGVMADKDYRAMMRTMYPLADTFLCATVDTSRSLQADELCQDLLEDGMSAVVSGDLLDGIQKAIALGEEKGERIIIFGSLYFIGEVKAMFEGGSIHLPEYE